jgi:hypothetical protein
MSLALPRRTGQSARVAGEDQDHLERRIRRLQQQLVNFEALAFAAIEFARQMARELADQQGVEPPTDDELRVAIVSLMEHRREEWAARWQDLMPRHADAEDIDDA